LIHDFNDLNDALKILSELHKISIIFINKEQEIIFNYSNNIITNPFYKSAEDLISSLEFKPDELFVSPTLKTNKYLESYFVIGNYSNNSAQGAFIIGPSIPSNLSNEMLINRFEFKNHDKILTYFNTLMDEKRFFKLISLIHFIIYNSKLDTDTIVRQEETPKKLSDLVQQLELNVIENRRNLMFHNSSMFGKKIQNAVREGQADTVKELFSSLRLKSERPNVKLNNQLRYKKNLSIAVITLGSRAAVDGGLHPEIAYPLSDLYIQQLEELASEVKVIDLAGDALYLLAKKVATSKEKLFSKPISICIKYIFKHIYDDITLTKLAEISDTNPSYLSSLFRKEVGITMTEYIQTAKINESKNLLILTKTPISDISNWLNFSDQSHFNRIFKKHTNVTPKQFRNENGIN